MVLQSELGDDVEPLAEVPLCPREERVAVSKLYYMQQSIKAEFKDGCQFPDAMDDLHWGCRTCFEMLDSLQ